MQLRTIESKIDYKFNDKNLLQEALTHSSLNLTKINYQRLEFLGDRVLGLIISEKIFNKMPDLSVGEMHLKFESLTNEKYLSKIAEKYSCGWIRKIHTENKTIPTTTITTSIVAAHACSHLFEYLNTCHKL